MVFAALVAAQSMIFGLAVSMTPPEGNAKWILHGILAASAVVVFALVGGPVLRTAWVAAKERRIVVEQLFLAGIFGAFFASLQCTITGHGDVYYEVVAILLAIYTFGQILGNQKRQAAMDAAKQLGDEFELAQKLLPDGRIEEVRTETIQPGDVVRVPSGGAIPVDGVIEHGVAFVKESALTGEAFPVVRRAGDFVQAGAYTLDQSLDIRATARGTCRTLDRLLETVRNAQSQKSNLQKEADRLVAWFLPLVLAIAALTFAGWTWTSGWETGLFRALAVLVVACPCSMGLATPIGVWAALSALSRRGIIARNSDLVETLGKVDTVVFDKTGTLGEERLEIVDFVTLEDKERTSVLEAVGAIESTSGHPIAMGFREFGISSAARASNLTLLPGVGISGKIDGALFEIGNPSLVHQDSEAVRTLRQKIKADSTGSHEVWVRKNGLPVALGILKERLRDSARSAIAGLEAHGIHVVVMTGDREAAASAHNLREVLSGLSPDQKAENVRQLQAAGRRVLFVGDGVNDAPAMAVAAASISVGGGSALARETSDAELLTMDLGAVPEAIFRCRQTLHAIRNNLRFAAVYNFVGISLAVAGIIHPVTAALLMLASSFTVSWMALRETAEKHSVRPAPARPRRSTGAVRGHNFLLPRWAVLVLSLGIALQGPVIGWLGSFPPHIFTPLSVLFAVAGLAFFLLLLHRTVEPSAGMAFTMFSLGGLFMLIGWWADSGFAAVVRDGVCLCGCPDSGMGWGLLFKANWMTLGMVAAALPTLGFERLAKSARPVLCWLAGLIGMLLGMELFGLVMALLPVSTASAGIHFFATYATMVLGMSLGMLIACEAVRKLVNQKNARA